MFKKNDGDDDGGDDDDDDPHAYSILNMCDGAICYVEQS